MPPKIFILVFISISVLSILICVSGSGIIHLLLKIINSILGFFGLLNFK